MALHKLFEQRPPPQKFPNAPNRHIHFYCPNFYDRSRYFDFDVLSGDEPPTIVGGYGQWTTLPRPLRRSLTLFTGYEPIQMRVTLRFIEQYAFQNSLGWRTDDVAGLAIEEKITKLEITAGSNNTHGAPALVYLSTADAKQGKTLPLIPFDYQPASPLDPKWFGVPQNVAVPWVITALEWGTAIRNDSGYRIRQDATMTVMMYVGADGVTQKNESRPKGTTFTSRTGADTPLLIARHEPTSYPGVLATAIMQAPQNAHLHLRRVGQLIKHNKKVYVPPGN